jgi:hypothetical protein
MENFKEIAEKCLAGELSGTFVTAFDNNWHSSYLQRYAILGHEMPEQYVLGPGIIYNDRGQCTSNEKVKIVDFIPDTMKDFKEIAEKCLAGKLSGTFILHNGEKKHVSKKDQTIHKDYLDPYSPYIIGNRKYSRCGVILPISNNENPYDIVDFIPDDITQRKIEINIPEGKVPVMEQTEKGVVITWKEHELTYTELLNEFRNNLNCIHTNFVNSASQAFYKKVEVIRKLTNIRNYFGGDKPTNSWIITIDSALRPFVIKNPKPYRETCFIYFDTQEHAQMAINMLGDELKYLFESW